MTRLLDELAMYIEILSHSARATNRAEDRSIYTKHLGASAEIFAYLHSGNLFEAKRIVAEQRHAYGWGYLSGEVGSAATSAFDNFAKKVEASHAA